VTATLAGPFITEPDVYDLPEAAYHRDPVVGGSLSSSGARTLLKECPAIFRYEQQHPKTSKAFDFGTAAHREVLGVGGDIVVCDYENWKTKKAQEEAAAARLAGKTPILTHEHQQVQAMAKALRDHPLAEALLTPEGGTPEQTLVWQDEATGIFCRAMLDWLPARNGNRLVVADYKGLSLDTAIPTPSGWTTMGALQTGDQVFGSDGNVCTVVAKSEVHWRRCYRMTFDDRSSVVCDDEHRWFTVAGGTSHPKPGVRTTEEIRRTLWFRGQRHHRVPIASALELPPVALPVDPYVLGCWLGDGGYDNGRISKPDQELFDLIAARGYQIGPTAPSQKRCPTRTIYGLSKRLRSAGVFKNKHIPPAYLRASIEQRIDLLRGLMDTDGSWNTTRGQAVFSTTDKALALSVKELACTLGQRAIVHTIKAKGFGLIIEAYHVTFSPVGGLIPFALSRKADMARSDIEQTGSPKRRNLSTRRVVIDVTEMPTVPTQCIQVDSADNTYLCTESMIPTHNTAPSADPEQFRRSVEKWGYHQQNDWYLDGIRALGLDDDPDFVFVVQMKTPPYLVSLIRLDEPTLRVAADRNAKARRIFARCQKSGYWPGFADLDIAEVGLPAYAVRQHDNDFDLGDLDD
jgi:hypothetical protein